jgi:hypothetical protein
MGEYLKTLQFLPHSFQSAIHIVVLPFDATYANLCSGMRTHCQKYEYVDAQASVETPGIVNMLYNIAPSHSVSWG